MANPSTKKGYFPIATELAKQLAKHNIPGEEMRIIWVVWLKTWAWAKGNRRKDDDWISYSQMAEMTGLKRSSAAAAVTRLLAKRLLLKTDNRLKFNQNYDDWLLAKRLTVVAKRLTPVSQKADKTVSQKTTHKINKETLTKETAVPTAGMIDEVNLIFNTFYETINPQIKFGRKDSRDAALWLIQRYGFDNAHKAAKYACSVFEDAYAPQIKTPAELKDKWANLVKYKNRQDGVQEK